MAILAATQCVRVWADGLSDKAALFALRKVTTGDTIDLTGEFAAVKQAVMIGTTVIGSATASVSGAVVTMPAGLSNDAAYLLVWGASA